MSLLDRRCRRVGSPLKMDPYAPSGDRQVTAEFHETRLSKIVAGVVRWRQWVLARELLARIG